MILDEIVEKTRIRVQREKAAISEAVMIERAERTVSKLPPFAFEQALAGSDIGFICEVKKASPSKGLIAKEFPYLQIAQDYEKSGAACISVLTEPDFFQGSNEYLTQIKEVVGIPVIRKDFVIDAYQIYQAKVIGADAVLLICAVLEGKTIQRYIQICDELGLTALVEAHNEEEIQTAIRAGARLIGVNNRNLKDFTVDIGNSERLRKQVPSDILFVAESGIRNGADIQRLREADVNGVLIGETLMRAKDKTQMLNELRGSRIKICGLTRAEDVRAVNRWKPDYAGFVFADTRRKVTDAQAKELRSQMDSSIRSVGVFVNDTIEHIVELCESGVIDVIQLHGDEDEEYIRELKQRTKNPVIRAVRVRSRQQLQAVEMSEADLLLLDAYHPEQYGGTGEAFDIDLIPEGYRPYILAGGITAENVADLIQKLHPYGIDVSSGVETDGKKDETKIAALITAVRGITETKE